MSNEKTNCSVCGTSFTPELTYQVEESRVANADGEPSTTISYYCSLDCVSRSHESNGRAQCDICGTAFAVELVSQVINHRGRRHHACSGECRHRLLERLNGPSLRVVIPLDKQPTDNAPTLRPGADIQVQPQAVSRRQVAPARGNASTVAQPVNVQTPVPPSATRTANPSDSGTTGPVAIALPLVPNQVRSSAQKTTSSLPRANVKAISVATAEAVVEDVQWKRIQASLGGRTQVVAVFNHKGGTGKTTTAVTVAAGLASKGRKVLLVDTDGQGNVGVSLGMQTERTLYHVLVMGLDPREAIVEVRPNLHVLPSNETLAAAELFLAGRPNRDRVLASRLSAMRADYEVIVVDCSPSLSLLNQNALVFADGVLCPVACDYLSLVGVRQVLRTIKQVNRLLSHPVRLWGVLPTLYDARARVCVEAYDTLRQHFGERCLAPIRMASRAKEAPSQAQTLFEYAPDATATKDYWQVVDQLFQDSDPSLGTIDLAVAGGAK